MDFTEVAALGDEIVLLGRIAAKVGSLESKGYIKKIYARDKGEEKGPIYLSLTAKGEKLLI